MTREDRFAVAVVTLSRLLDQQRNEEEWQAKFPIDPKYYGWIKEATETRIGEARVELRSAFEQMEEP